MRARAAPSSLSLARLHPRPRPPARSPRAEYLPMDTTNILFICGGAFTGLQARATARERRGPPPRTPRAVPHPPAAQDVVARRLRDTSIGFGTDAHGGADGAAAGGRASGRPVEDLIAFGFLPEFVGRFPVGAQLRSLSEEEMMHVMTAPRNALFKQYAKLFSADGVQLQARTARPRARAAPPPPTAPPPSHR